MHWRKVDIIEELQFLADIDAQIRFHQEVGIVNAAHEIVNSWFDESFFPEESWIQELFDEKEWRILTDFHSFFESIVDGLPDEYNQFISSSEWCQLVKKASQALSKLGWNEIDIAELKKSQEV